MRLFDIPLGWATPYAPRYDYQTLARALGYRDAHSDCLPRRQGKCPGLEYCADCSWREGTSRQRD